MKLLSLAFSSFRHFKRHNLGLALCWAVTCAVLVGALNLGGVVSSSLEKMTWQSLGQVKWALQAPNRTFEMSLAERLKKEASVDIVPFWFQSGSVHRPDGALRLNECQIWGVPESFWGLGEVELSSSEKTEQPFVVLNSTAAERLEVQKGDSIIVRVPASSAVPSDLMLAEEELVAIRVTISAIFDADRFGDFSLGHTHVAPFNLYLPLSFLQNELEIENRVNGLVATQSTSGVEPDWKGTMQAAWSLSDLEMELIESEDGKWLDLKTKDIFFPTHIEAVLREQFKEAQFIFAYLVNRIASDAGFIPYSMVAAVDGPINSGLEGFQENEILLSDWALEDLGLKAGATITLRFFLPDRSKKLLETDQDFILKGAVPSTIHLDGGWMPDYPGMSEAESCMDWDSGMPIDMSLIRKKDEAYWETHKGTPKALIHMKRAQAVWDNRFGKLTSIRFPNRPGLKERVEMDVLQTLAPEDFGFTFLDVRTEAQSSLDQAMGFGGLFAGFSFFILFGALGLTALTFMLQMEYRRREMGTYLALGFRRSMIVGIWIWEMLLVAIPAMVVGVLLGLGYCWLLFYAIGGVWAPVIGTPFIEFDILLSSLGSGVAMALGITLITLVLMVIRGVREPVTHLLQGSALPKVTRKNRLIRWVGPVLFMLGAFSIYRGSVEPDQQAVTFFTGGFFLLFGGLALFYSALVRRPPVKGAVTWTLFYRAWNNNRLFALRSLSIVSMVGFAVFLIISVDAYRLSAQGASEKLSSGTGGFDFILSSTVPMAAEAVLDQVGKDDFVVPIRLRQGDDTSCLNLKRAVQPRLLGVPFEALLGRFTFLSKGEYPKRPWQNLEGRLSDGSIPVIGNFNTLMYSLGLKVGDQLDWVADNGEPCKLRVVAALDNCLFQEGILISEANFLELHPSQALYQRFLIDAQMAGQIETRVLSESLSDFGVEAQTTEDYLARYDRVQNTYISIFQSLGILGLFLGTAGLAALLFRNVSDRQAELALYRALGYRPSQLFSLVLLEHLMLFAFGLFLGLGTSAIALAPRVIQFGVPVITFVAMPSVLFILGLGVVFLSAKLALKTSSLDALRRE